MHILHILICAQNLCFAQKLCKKGKNFSRSLEPQKIAPKAKSCSKVAEHNQDSPTCSTSSKLSVLHFFQVVWKNTKEIGAAKRIRNDSRLVVVIRYFPPGNLISGKEAFKKNVLPIPERERGGAIERRASLALTGFVFIVGTCCQFLF